MYQVKNYIEFVGNEHTKTTELTTKICESMGIALETEQKQNTGNELVDMMCNYIEEMARTNRNLEHVLESVRQNVRTPDLTPARSRTSSMSRNVNNTMDAIRLSLDSNVESVNVQCDEISKLLDELN